VNCKINRRFQAFIPLSFHSQNTEIKQSAYTTGFDDLKTLAISRLMLDNFDHIKAYWVMLGEKSPRCRQLARMTWTDRGEGRITRRRAAHGRQHDQK
jgi:aminodeoxyfutalosine synthase